MNVYSNIQNIQNSQNMWGMLVSYNRWTILKIRCMHHTMEYHSTEKEETVNTWDLVESPGKTAVRQKLIAQDCILYCPGKLGRQVEELQQILWGCWLTAAGSPQVVTGMWSAAGQCGQPPHHEPALPVGQLCFCAPSKFPVCIQIHLCASTQASLSVYSLDPPSRNHQVPTLPVGNCKFHSVLVGNIYSGF